MATRILHIVPTLDRGGIEQSLISLCRQMDRERFQFDFLVHSLQKGSLEKETAQLGCGIFHVCARRDGESRNRKELAAFFQTHGEYCIVVQHVSSLSYLAPLAEARRAGITIRVLHCHNMREGGKGAIQLLHRALHL
ncbi:MAG: hypothetical protein LUI07_05145, partial [Lachnospiraceae bacterium]|nr:hypothetical protein [Lachnospiraceae bacterium]